MKIRMILLLVFIHQGLLLPIYGQSITRLNGSRVTTKELDNTIKRLTTAAGVHGLAISIFNNNKVVYQKTFGYSNYTIKDTLHTHTNLYGASLSKAVFAVLVMQLVQDGLLDLDTPLQNYLPQPIYTYTPATRWHDNYSDLKTDTTYKRITARMCLSHSSGFPNWRWDESDEQLRLKFAPGTRYGYSGEGMVYLQVVLEKMLGKPLDSLMQERIFTPLGMHHSAYYWKPAFEQNFAYGHRADSTLYNKDKDNEPRSASTLETTLDDYTLFTEGVLQYKVLSPASTKTMFTPQIKIRSVQQHGPLRIKDSTLNDNIGLSAGLGWLLLQSPYGVGAFKEGHGDGFQHYSIIFPEKGTGIVIMTNSDNGESIFKELLEFTIADRFTPWYWENYIPYNYHQQ